MGRVTTWIGVTLAVLVIATGCGRPTDAPDRAAGKVSGWNAGQPDEFVGDELFMLINGGAEIYHEYGFSAVEVQEFERGDERISVEIYTMDGDAFGIYSWARARTGQPVELGAGGTLAEYYLHFWSGPHLVVVTAQNPGDDPRTAVLELGETIASEYPPAGAMPKIVDLIPIDHCSTASAVHFVGPIGFNSVAPRLAPYFAGFQDGVAADCSLPSGETERLLFLRWTDPPQATRAIAAAADRFGAAEGARIEVIDDANFTVYFDTGTVVAGLRPHPELRSPDHLLRITMAEGHRPKLDELPFWCSPSRSPS